MSRSLTCLLLAAASLVSCGSVTPSAPATLKPLEDCPSCGLLPITVSVNEFWGWSSEQQAPQIWNYGAERQREHRREVFVLPTADVAFTNAGQVWMDRPLGCLNTFNPFELDAVTAPILRVTAAVAAASLTDRRAADSLCLNAFGPGWTALTSAGSELLTEQAGFWVTGSRPVEEGIAW